MKRVSDVFSDVETKEAWDEYLAATKGLVDPRYSEVESWAYRRLETRLRIIARKKPVAKTA